MRAGRALLVPIAAALLSLAACSGHEGSVPPPARYTILCEGDGFTRGLEGNDYATQLEKLLNERAGRRVYRAVNIGKPGQSTAGLADGLPRHFRQERPDLLVVIAGMDNDWNSVHLPAGSPPGGLEREANDLTHLDEFDRDFYEAPKRSRETLLAAMALQRRGEYEKAMEGFRRFIELEPGEIPGYAGLAACLMRRGRLDEAVEVLGKAAKVKRAPELLEIYVELGWAQRRRGDMEKALGAWKEGLRGFPASRRLFQSLAAGCRMQGNVWKALDYGKDMPEIKGRNPLYKYLEKLRQAYGREDFEEAIRGSMREDVRRICAEAKKRRVPVVFASYPELVVPGVLEEAAAAGARVVDLREVFRKRFKDRGDYLTSDNYQSSEAGYRLLAEILAGEVEGSLPPPAR